MGLRMGRMGGLRPPANLARRLRDFDSALEIQWNYALQQFEVVQWVRRQRLIGEYAGSTWHEVYDAPVPVLRVSEVPGPMDERIIGVLSKMRAQTQREKDWQIIERIRDQRAAERAQSDAELAPAAEAAENAWHDPAFRRNTGLSPRVHPVGGWPVPSQGAESAPA